MNTLTVKERIISELGYMKKDADAGKIEAFFSVRLDRTDDGRVVPTATVIAPDSATWPQVEAFFVKLQEIGELIKAVTEATKEGETCLKPSKG